jgi:hypothetical protein
MQRPLSGIGGRWAELNVGSGFGTDIPIRGVGPGAEFKLNPDWVYHIGCGNGTKWLKFNSGPHGTPAFPPTDYTPVASIDRFRSDTGEYVGTVFISTAERVQNFETALYEDRLVLPVSKDKHIVIFRSRYYWGYDVETGYYWHSIITSGRESREFVGVFPWRASGTDNVPSLIGIEREFGLGNYEYEFDRFPPEFRIEYWNAGSGGLGGSPQNGGWELSIFAPGDTPIFPDASLGVISARSEHGYTLYSKAFLVSDTNIKEINIPAQMETWLQEFTQESQVETITINSDPNAPLEQLNAQYLFRFSRFWSFASYVVLPVQRTNVVPLSFDSIYAEAQGFSPKATSRSATPDIYRAMNDAVQFTSPENIKPFPAKQRWILEDLDAPGVFGEFFKGFECPPKAPTNFTSVYKDLYKPGNKFYYARWGVPNEEPTYAYFDPDCWGSDTNPYPQIKKIKKPKILATSLVPRPGVPGEEQGYLSSYITASSDGGDPAYCRAMLRELGFTAEDLSFG